ncbi:MAG: hypothetical protein GVY33_08880 [Alphaproteobacteria bacterium]|jgi:hypothetical protein|nr:hypothetical protein [Alphaproteobacteria bacterium]
MPEPDPPSVDLVEVVASKRSAHHAFINWFCNHAPRPLVYFNNVWPTSRPRLRHARVAHADLTTTDAALKRSPLELLTTFPLLTVLNFEGRLPLNIDRWNREFLAPRTTKRVRQIVFLRDPVNTAASLAWRTKTHDYVDLFRFFHQIHGIEALLTTALDAPAAVDEVVPLWRWQEDDGFRRDLAGRWRLRDAALPEDVSRFGGGSSFGDTAFAGDDRRRLYARWRQALHSPLFLAPFTDDRFCALTRAYIDALGHGADVALADLDTVVRAARGSERAARWKRRFLDGLRAGRALLVELERSPSRPYREYLRARLRLRLARG